MIRLTARETGQPVIVNSDHIISIRPRKDIVPVDVTQNPSVQFKIKGTVLNLVGGERLNVNESFDDVHKALLDTR